MIRIIRPTNSRDQFGDGADYKGPRSEVYRTSNKKLKTGKDAAEQMFHIFNAPEEMLENWERTLAKDFRFSGHYSLSVGDVVEVKGKQFLCESFGWKEIDSCNEINLSTL
tara:strand:- start:1944 stop:2273 length:330 start_codon:yes stop_codon:yes gene_type:complete